MMGPGKGSGSNNNNNNSIPVTIFVKSSTGTMVAAKLSGYFVIKNQEFRFSAVAFGRIGGHNISVKIPKSTIEKIRKMGIDPDALEQTLQRKLIEGDVTLPSNLKPPE